METDFSFLSRIHKVEKELSQAVDDQFESKFEN